VREAAYVDREIHDLSAARRKPGWSTALVTTFEAQIAKQLDEKIAAGETTKEITKDGSKHVLHLKYQNINYTVNVHVSGYQPKANLVPARWALDLYAWMQG
jgi:hypothetical protein